MTRRGPRASALALAAVLAAAACRHARQAPPDEGREEAQPGRQGAAGGVKPAPDRPRVPPSPEGLLAPDAIREMQRALADRKLLGEHREGDVDPPTSAALRRFQAEHGLAATGFPDRDTLQRLGVDPEKAYRRARE